MVQDTAMMAIKLAHAEPSRLFRAISLSPEFNPVEPYTINLFPQGCELVRSVLQCTHGPGADRPE
jgi:hypothetical protein